MLTKDVLCRIRKLRITTTICGSCVVVRLLYDLAAVASIYELALVAYRGADCTDDKVLGRY
jgi:hypothetical protein